MRRRVLIIEDNKANMELACYLVQAHGWQCDMAEDGEDGIRLARKEPPDVVLCDLQLPTIDGFEVLRRFRADPLLASVPMLAVTAFAMVGDRERVLAAGFDGYIPKPLDPQRFVQQISAVAGWPAPAPRG